VVKRTFREWIQTLPSTSSPGGLRIPVGTRPFTGDPCQCTGPDARRVGQERPGTPVNFRADWQGLLARKTTILKIIVSP
jgi:hypothetical protein